MKNKDVPLRGLVCVCVCVCVCEREREREMAIVQRMHIPDSHHED